MEQTRHRLVQLLKREGIQDPAVLAAIGRVPRHEFLPEAMRSEAYANRPLPIGHAQTISQPYIVALMTQLLCLHPGDRVLEIGTGSGYQTAILAEIGARVFTVEIVPELAANARRTLDTLGYEQIRQHLGDGRQGWPDHAPYDAIVVTAAPTHVPPSLLAQLRPRARLLVPLGSQTGPQTLTLISRDAAGELTRQAVATVRFVPLVTRQAAGTESPYPAPRPPPRA